MFILEDWSESFFLCSFKSFYLLFLDIKLSFNVEWLEKVKPATKSLYDSLLMADITGL